MQAASLISLQAGLRWFAIMLLVVGVRAAEAPSQFLSRTWQTEDGLPHNAVNAIAQAPDGYLWLATRDGLVRFDGVRFVRMEPALFPGVKDRALTSLCQGRDGTLWIGAENGRFAGLKNGKTVELPLPQAASFGAITRIFESRDGALWIGTATNGLIRWQNGDLTQWTATNGLANAPVRSICEDADGAIWVGTGAALNRLKNGMISTFTTRDGLLHNSIRLVYADRQGDVWIGSAYGLTRMKDGRCLNLTAKEGLGANLVTAILEDRDGTLWIGTFNGLNRICNAMLLTANRDDGSSYDRVNDLFEDTEGNLWIATRDGLTRLKPRVITAFTKQQGLTHNLATSVLEARDGSMWVGFWGGGVNRIMNGTVTAYTIREGLSSDLVMALHQDRNNEMWFGMDYDGGITRLKADGKFVHYRQVEGMKDQAVKALQDGAGRHLWIGTRTALLALNDGKFERFTAKDGLPSESIEAILEGRDGRVWFGTAAGLAVWDDSKLKAFLPKGTSITSIIEDADGALWMGTRGGGLNYLRGDKLFSCTTRHGLFHDEICGLVEDGLGFIWMSCPEGIFRVSKAELLQFFAGRKQTVFCLPFGKADGMPSVECRGSGKTAACRSQDGRLWFPTSKGIVAVDPTPVRMNDRPPPVYFEELLVDGRPADLSQPCRIVARRQDFVFRFTALCLAAPEKVRFRYKLEGLDDRWIEAGNRREARYAYLPPGEYRFRVIAANGDGIWNLKGTTFSLLLITPFWRTWWFLSLCIVGAGGVTIGATRYFGLRKMRLRLAQVQHESELERERARIARDLHDDLGTDVTQISMLSDLAEATLQQPDKALPVVRDISTMARKVVDELDEIVWAVNPRNDTLDHLGNYLGKMASDLFKVGSVRCNLDIPPDLPPWTVTSEMRHHVFMAVKEALNNALKYAQASEVCLKIAAETDSFTIQVTDNGKGFVVSSAAGDGNGLINMRQRIEEIGGRFELKSAPGSGTQIHMTIPRRKQ